MVMTDLELWMPEFLSRSLLFCFLTANATVTPVGRGVCALCHVVCVMSSGHLPHGWGLCLPLVQLIWGWEVWRGEPLHNERLSQQFSNVLAPGSTF